MNTIRCKQILVLGAVVAAEGVVEDAFQEAIANEPESDVEYDLLDDVQPAAPQPKPAGYMCPFWFVSNSGSTLLLTANSSTGQHPRPELDLFLAPGSISRLVVWSNIYSYKLE